MISATVGPVAEQQYTPAEGAGGHGHKHATQTRYSQGPFRPAGSRAQGYRQLTLLLAAEPGLREHAAQRAVYGAEVLRPLLLPSEESVRPDASRSRGGDCAHRPAHASGAGDK